MPGGSTIGKVANLGNPDGLINWAIRLSETCTSCQRESLAKSCTNEECRDFQKRNDGLSHENVRNESADFGKCIHKAVECRFKGEPFPFHSYPPVYAQPAQVACDNLYAWLNEQHLQVVFSERAIVDEEDRTGNTLDLGLKFVNVEWKARPIVGDLKTSNGIWPEHLIQVAGCYRRAVQHEEGVTVRDVVLIRIDRDTLKPHGHWVPPEIIEAADEAAVLCRRLYEVGKVLKRRFA